MNQYEQWERNNEEYLSSALEWLRLRLHRLAAGGPGDGSRNRDERVQKRGDQSPDSNLDREIDRAAEAMASAEALIPAPAFSVLGRQFGLSRFEQDILLLCTGMELDTRVAGLCARAQDDPAKTYPTFALALALFDNPSWDALLPERPLRHFRLIEVHQAAPLPLTTSPLQADERVLHFIKGLNRLDDRLVQLIVPFDIESPASDVLSPSQYSAAEALTQHLNAQYALGRPALIQLVGPDTASKQAVALEAANASGNQVFRIPVEMLPSQAGELEAVCRLWQRESALLPIILYFDTSREGDPGSAGGTQTGSSLDRFLSRYAGHVILDTVEVRSGLDHTTLVRDVDKPARSEQKSGWAAALGEHAGDSPAILSGQFDLNMQAIRQIASSVLPGSHLGNPGLQERLWSECLARTRPRMEKLAQRLDPKATWEDLVIPEEQRSLLRQIADQVRQRSFVYDEWGFRNRMNRGLGISALFTGESGTGKTMAAEVLANDLHLNLYRIDLSSVVSKYIGETEKNLRRVFNAVEDGGAILFFDEADALFGKRSEVKDSHDRYANIEINYLLQRIEAFRGLAILATNMKSSLDPAFIRRLRFVVSFPFPGQAERRNIWEKVFPPETKTEGLDFERLARLNLTGGSIHNAALNAAFLAASAGTPVTMPLVFAAARTEFRKMERPVNEADFQWTDQSGRTGGRV